MTNCLDYHKSLNSPSIFGQAHLCFTLKNGFIKTFGNLAERDRLSASGLSDQKNRNVETQVEVSQVNDARQFGSRNEDVGVTVAYHDLKKIRKYEKQNPFSISKCYLRF